MQDVNNGRWICLDVCLDELELIFEFILPFAFGFHF